MFRWTATIVPEVSLQILQPNTATQNAQIGAKGVSTYFAVDGTNVGIGTNLPNQKLEVRNGNIRMSETTNNTYTDLAIGTGGAAIFDINPYVAATYNASVRMFRTTPAGTPQVSLQILQPNTGTQNAQIGAKGVPTYFAIDGTNVGIGTTTPAYQLQLSLNSAAKPTSNTWTIASDARIKNVVGGYTKGLTELLGIDPIVYTYKKNNALGIVDPGEHIGIIAQEVQKVFPEAVSTDVNGYLHFNSDTLFWASVNAIKELDSKIENQQKQIQELTAGNAALQGRLDALETR
jgi:hypothetical protein